MTEKETGRRDIELELYRTVGGLVGWLVCRIIVSALVPVPFLWTLGPGFETWIWDLDLGLGFATGLGLDNINGLNKVK